MIELTSNLGNVSVITEGQAKIVAIGILQHLIISASITDGNDPDLFQEDVLNSTKMIQENVGLPIIFDVEDEENPPTEYYLWDHIYEATSSVKMDERDYHEFMVWSEQTKDLVNH